MDIQSLIERVGGTVVTMGSTAYHFKPREANGPHLAVVNARKHIARFLAIPEGYCIPESDEEEEITDAPVALTEPAQDVDATTATTEPVIDPVEALQSILHLRKADTRADAEAAFEHVFGRAANGRAKTETIVSKIIEHAVAEGLIEAEVDTGAEEPTEAAEDTGEVETVEPAQASEETSDQPESTTDEE
jgi:hypothetical protein